MCSCRLAYRECRLCCGRIPGTLVEEAGDGPRRQTCLGEGGHGAAAPLHGMVATRLEGAAGGQIARIPGGKPRMPARGVRGPRSWGNDSRSPWVWVLGTPVDEFGRSYFDDASGVHDGDLVGQLEQEGQIRE